MTATNQTPSALIDPTELDGYRDSADLADQVNTAHAAWQADVTNRDLRGAYLRLAGQYRQLRREYRQTEAAAGRRHDGGGPMVVSHLDADGQPDTSTDEGMAYWDEVARAADLDVPANIGPQR